MIRQIDHILPHHRGGPTSLANGQGLCVRCNLAKELGRWEVAPVDDAPVDDGSRWTIGRAGLHRWASPHGAVGYSSPPSVIPHLLRAEAPSEPPEADAAPTVPGAEPP